ncbi:MAG: alginate lyase family protein [Candidatus Sulfotelmatobacter sp.]
MGKLGAMLQVGRTFGVRDGMLRLEYELRRGSGLMSLKMRSVQGWDPWRLTRISPDVTSEEMRAARRDGTRRFLFTDPRALGTTIKKIIWTGGEESILTEANRILAGNLPFFGQLSFACGFPPQWFQNPATGEAVSPQQVWTQMRFASPAYGDLKFTLEPSRFLFVYPLVRAYALSGDERFPQAFWNAIEDWAHHSPPMAGPLWICGQECALRILALSFALHAFIHSPSTTNERFALLVSMIAAHAWRTAQTLSYARSQRSNHLISEAVGLWTAGTLYPELREATVWQNLGADLLQKAVLDQITPEGVSQQHSFNYQRMILHLLLWTLCLAEIHNSPLHEDVRQRTQAAFDFIRSWVDPVSGFTPNYGSDDGSLILPLALGAYRDFRPLLQLGAAILNRPPLQPGSWDEAALWFGVKTLAAEKTGAPKKTASPPAPVETGYFRLGDENSWALIRAGRYTRRPFQADQLHVDLWSHGINLARDAGTYLYNGAAPWNNGFAGTSIHNTITVDHRDQMRRAGRFLWLDWAQASGRLSSSPSNSAAERFEGEHDGYRNLGVRHRRMVQWLHGAGWVIVDDIKGLGAHNVRLHWLATDLPYEISNSPFQVTFATKQSAIRWNIFSSIPGSTAVIRAGKQATIHKEIEATPNFVPADMQLLGWEAPTYGNLRPAISLVYETQSQLPVRIVTVILTDERCNLQAGSDAENDQIVVSRTGSFDKFPDSSEVYRVSLAASPTPSPETNLSPTSVPRA